ncbi:MAG: PfkB family carbohydrate kinase [Planctomycetota bacterium]|nr:PfkB family carbohydrate kinase [Planctomycetota bacterium]
MASIDVVGFGECSIDYVYVVPALPDAKVSKVRVSSYFSACGGQVATAMAACSALGLRASYVGPVGTDDNAQRVLTELRAEGVAVSRAIVREASTRYAVILVDKRSGDRCVLWDRDPRLRVLPADIPDDLCDGARVLHVDGVDEDASIAAARLARRKGVMVTSDIDSMTARTAELVDAVSVPIFAEHVPSQLTGETDVEAALRALRLRHDGLLIVTLGEHGSAALDGGQFHHVEAPQVNAIDKTGAGDVFRAAAIYGLLQHWTTRELLRFANTAAAKSCMQRGAIGAVPALADITGAPA